MSPVCTGRALGRREQGCKCMRFISMVLVTLGRCWHLLWKSVRSSLSQAQLAQEGLQWQHPTLSLTHLDSCFCICSHDTCVSCFLLVVAWTQSGVCSLCGCSIYQGRTWLILKGLRDSARSSRSWRCKGKGLQDSKPGLSVPEFRLLIGRLSCHRSHNCSLKAK